MELLSVSKKMLVTLSGIKFNLNIIRIYMRKSFFLYFLLFMFAPAMAQEVVPVDVSENIVVISGKRYYIHDVAPRQTLYSISRAYGVLLDDIYHANKGLKDEGLKVGSRIKIPKEAEKEVDAFDHDRYIYHVIRKGETLYSLSRRYNVPVDVIIDNNEELEKESLQINQVLRIPKKKIDSETSVTEERDEDGHVIHKVQRRETLYSISRVYGVSIENILKLNRDVAEDGLKHKQEIRIPKALKDTTEEKVKKEHRVAFFPDTIVEEAEQPVDCDTLRLKEDIEEINIAVMLPFYTQKNTLESYMADSNLYRGMDEHLKKRRFADYIYPKSRVSLDLYEGILLAVKEFKQSESHKINLYVYDTRADSNVVKSFLAGRNLPKMDMIIGPAFYYNFLIVADFAKKHEIPVISPLSSRYLCAENSLTVQVKPTDYIQVSSFFRYLKDSIAGQDQNPNFIMIYDNHIADIDEVDLYKQMIDRFLPPRVKRTKDTSKYADVKMDSLMMDSLIVYDTIPMVRKIIYSEELREKVIEEADTNRINYFFIPSSREAFVSNVTSTLNALTLTHDVKLFGLPSWQSFRNVDLDEFYNLGLVFYTPYYLDWQSETINNWIRTYRKTYHTDIFNIASDGANHSVLGYDIAAYFLKAFTTYGKNFCYCLSGFDEQSILTDFQFRQARSGDGSCNTSISVIQYHQPTYTLKKIK